MLPSSTQKKSGCENDTNKNVVKSFFVFVTDGCAKKLDHLSLTTPSTMWPVHCNIDFYNFRHWKVQNFEISNLFERHQKFAVIFGR